MAYSPLASRPRLPNPLCGSYGKCASTKCAHNIRGPTLVVRGAQSDLVSPEGVQEFVDAVPGARYIDVADAGHMVAGDQNDHFTTAILGFLDTLRPGG